MSAKRLGILLFAAAMVSLCACAGSINKTLYESTTPLPSFDGDDSSAATTTQQPNGTDRGMSSVAASTTLPTKQEEVKGGSLPAEGYYLTGKFRSAL